MSTCRKTQYRLGDYLEGALAPPERAELERHLAQCPGCQAEHQAMQRAHEALLALARPESAPELPLPAGVGTAPSLSPFRLAAAGAAAAALLVVTVLAPRNWAPKHRAEVPTTIGRAPVIAEAPVPGDGGPASDSLPAVRPVVVPEQAPVLRPTPPRHAAKARPPRRQTAGGHRPPAAHTTIATTPAQPESVPAAAPAAGVVLLVADTQPRRSYSYQVEVSLPGGQRSSEVREVQRDDQGNVTLLRFASETTGPVTGSGG